MISTEYFTISMNEIQCCNCHEWKEKLAYNKQAASKSGLQSQCRQCASERLKRHYAALTSEQKIDKRRRQDEHRIANPEMYRWTGIRSRYHINKEDFDKMFADQGKVCAICQSPDPGGSWNQWAIDHDHACCSGVKSCGKCIRGILCIPCNHGLGSFRDSPTSLRTAADYLDRILHD